MDATQNEIQQTTPGLGLLAFERLVQRTVGRMSPIFGPSPLSEASERLKKRFKAEPEKIARKSRFVSDWSAQLRSNLAFECAEEGDYGPWVALCESRAPICPGGGTFKNKGIEIAIEKAPTRAIRAFAVANLDYSFGGTLQRTLTLFDVWDALVRPECAGLEEDPRALRSLGEIARRITQSQPDDRKLAKEGPGGGMFFDDTLHDSMARKAALAAKGDAEHAATLIVAVAKTAPKGRRVALFSILCAMACGEAPALAAPLGARASELLSSPEALEAFFAAHPAAIGRLSVAALDGEQKGQRVFDAAKAMREIAVAAAGPEAAERAMSPSVRVALRAVLEAEALAAVVSETSAAKGAGETPARRPAMRI
jgi:hypothetical protein